MDYPEFKEKFGRLLRDFLNQDYGSPEGQRLASRLADLSEDYPELEDRFYNDAAVEALRRMG